MSDLTVLLGESLIWMELRHKLVSLLKEQADAGNAKASAELVFLSTNWPGGGAPRVAEFARLSKSLTDITNFVLRMASQGMLPTHMVATLATLGITLPEPNQGAL